MDWYSRRVLAWRLSNTMDSQFCIEALKEAMEDFGQPDFVRESRNQPVGRADHESTFVVPRGRDQRAAVGKRANPGVRSR